jgi:hypothetical protein
MKTRIVSLSVFLILTMHALTAQVNSSHIETYLWEYPLQDSLVVDPFLLEELLREIDTIVAGGDLFYRPLPNNFSDQIYDNYFLYLEPGRIIHTVAKAYPYLHPTVQDSLRGMVAHLLAHPVHRPWAPNPLPLDQGKERMPYTPDRVWGLGSDFGLYRPSIQNVYSLWLYVYRSGDTLTVQPYYNDIRNFYNNKVWGNHDRGTLYGTMQSHIGMARLAEMFGDTLQIDAARNNLANALNNGQQMNTIDSLARNGTQGWNGAYALAYENRNINWVNLNYVFLDLSPEIARYLSQYLYTETASRHQQYLNRFPLWWLRQAPYFTRWTGDEGIGIPSNTFGINMPLERWFMQRDHETLASYMLSGPTGAADSYWIEALVLALESNALDVWVDVRQTPFSTDVTLPTYQIMATANPPLGGSITGAGSYAPGDTTLLIASPLPGYTFTHWTEQGNMLSTDSTLSFTVAGHRTFVAHFAENLLLCNDITLYLDSSGSATTTPETVMKYPMNGAILSITLSQELFSCIDVGNNPVILTVTDNHSNIRSCTATIEILDTITPILVCQVPAIPNKVNQGCQYVVSGTALDATGWDHCSHTLQHDYAAPSATSLQGASFPIGTSTVVWTIEDASGNSSSCMMDVVVEGLQVSGYITYHNTPNTPMHNVGVTLTNVTGIFSTTTDAAGFYTMEDVCHGIYEVNFTTSKQPGGINATDAGLTNVWGIQSIKPYIEVVQFRAGDVSYDGQINSFDASQILAYFVTSGNAGFAAPAWSFWNAGQTQNANPPTPATPSTPTINLTEDLSEHFFALVTGDFNRSYVPGNVKTHGNVFLQTSGSMKADPGEVVNLAILAGHNMEVAAASLIMNYPTAKVEILGVTLGNQNIPVQNDAQNGILRIGWYSMFPVMLIQGDPLFNLKIRVTSPLMNGEQITFTLPQDPLIELADASSQVIPAAVLTISTIESTVGTEKYFHPGNQNISLINHPNPFSSQTTFTYQIPVSGKVLLEVYDMLGRKVAMPINETQKAGEYTFGFDTRDLPSGVYYSTLHLLTDEVSLSRSVRIVKPR